MTDSTTPQDSAAMPPASSGSVDAEPVAWMQPNQRDLYVSDECDQWHTVPLYRQPQPTLTDLEREAIEWAAAEADQWEDTEPAPHAYAESLRSLLERLK